LQELLGNIKLVNQKEMRESFSIGDLDFSEESD